ncbi:malate permease [Philodulcilactobacillus myokoensis]|uniref:Malate permease n=1 Tax=Philodulcilactobacillus myokoensis TaxID=2929573 RepID=A0A9W6AYY8_9LACO|nr:AEC family transporter [Philodulcilactobacillus myokoensis]GLB46150.1 malate permease [Philodulcilactobacillus myokoensis]
MSTFLNSIQSVLVVVIIMILGYILRKTGWFADTFGANIAKFIKNIALPASIFVSVLQKLTRDKLISFSSYLIWGIISVIIGYIISYILVKVLKVRKGRRGVFINAIVNANTIFIGLPLNLALFGDNSMTYFLVYYIINTVSTWAFGVFLISNDDPTKENQPKEKHHINWKQVLPMPLVGFLVALVFLLTNIPVLKVPFVAQSLGYVGSLVTPLSLIYIGIVLADAGLKSIRFDRDTVVALLGRFVMSPVVMIILMIIAGHMVPDLPKLLSQTMIIQSATPMLAVLPILAADAHGDVKYATNIVTTSTVLFIVVIPILMTIIQYI